MVAYFVHFSHTYACIQLESLVSGYACGLAAVIGGSQLLPFGLKRQAVQEALHTARVLISPAAGLDATGMSHGFLCGLRNLTFVCTHSRKRRTS